MNGSTGGGECVVCGQTVPQSRVDDGLSAYYCSRECNSGAWYQGVYYTPEQLVASRSARLAAGYDH